jgi:acyl-CoA synthetase (NDP forming)
VDDSKNPVASDPLTVMLEARGIALVGASPRPGSLGARMIEEVAKSPSRPRTYLVNPRYAEIGGTRCYPGLADLPEPADLALLAVADAALEEQVRAAAAGGARAAVIFGSAVDPPSQLTPRPGPATRQASAARSPVSLASPGAATEARNAFAPNSGAVAAGPGHGPSLRERIAAIARDAGMAVCGAGCMGFVNVARGLRAIGYQEPDPLPSGPAALVTHSGSVFSALLRARRAFGFTLAVSSGQELVTPAAAYARYALTLPETKVLVLVLEAIRDAPALRSVLADAAARDLPVLLLTAGASAASRSLVAAHSGALASGDGAWQALASAYGVHRVSDLAELADTLELFTLTRRTPRSPSVPDQAGAVAAGDSGTRDGSTAQAVTASGGGRDDLAADGSRAPREVTASGGRDDLAGGGSIHASGGLPAGLGGTAPEESAGRGIATVHDSGFERAHVADVAAAVGVPFATLDEATKQRLAAVLDPGLEPGNPLDVWGTGRDPEALFTEALSALADDPAVGAVALAVDLVPEYNGDDSYRAALLAAAAKTGKPLTVLASIPAAIDQETASSLRAAGIPVLESTRTGLLALGHLLARATSPELAGATSPEAEPPPYEPHECAIDVAIAPSMAHSFTPHIGPAATAAISGAASDPAGATPRSARRSRWSAALAAGPATTASPPSRPARPPPWTGPWRPRPSSATRSPSRPTPPASPTSPTWAASASAFRARPSSPPPTRTCPPASTPALPSPKWPGQARSSSSAWPATRPSARSSSSAPAGSSRSSSPSAPWPFPR